MAAITAPAYRASRWAETVAHFRRWWPAWLLTLITGLLILYPLVSLFLASFRGADGSLTLANYEKAFTSTENYGLIWTTFWLAAVRVVLASAIGISLAWVVTRTDTPWRGGMEVLFWIGFFAPPLPIVVAWTMLANSVGILNNLVRLLPFVHGPVFDIYSYLGIIWVSSLHLAALIFLLTVPAFRSMDASLEEAARMCGARRLETLFKITVPAVLPAILGAMFYCFVLAVESFETEVFLGTPAHIYVLSTKIYSLAEEFPQDLPGATTLSAFTLLAVTVLIIIQMRLLAGKSFVTVTGRGFAVRVTPLGRWRWVAFGLGMLYFFISTVLPLSILVAGSFMRGFGIWSMKNVTTDAWTGFFSDPRLTSAIINTIILGVTVGIVGTALVALTGYVLVRTDFKGRPLLEFITWAPRTAPAVVLAVAFLWAYVSGTPIFQPLLGTIWIMALVLVINGIPLGSRSVNSALYQISTELEQAARISGASWFRAVRHVVLPLLAPALMTSFVLLFLLTIRNLVLVIFFYTPDSRVLSTILWEAWIGRSMEQGLVAGVIMMIIASIALAAALILRRRAVSSMF